MLESYPGTSRWHNTANSIFVISTIVCLSVLSTYAILQYNNFEGAGLDLAEFDQVIWNSMHGRLFESSVLAFQWQITHGVTVSADPVVGGGLPQANKLGDHFAPLLLMLVPVYALFSNPVIFKLVQTIALVGMVFPLYWFARPRIGHFLALTLTFAFFISPILPGINTYDFHENVLTTIPLALALFFLFRKRDAPFLVCLILALLAKEDIAFIVAEFGLLVIFLQRKFRLGLGVLALGVGYAILVMGWLKPSFAPTDMGYWLGRLYPALGGGYLDLVNTLITQYLFDPQRIAFVLHLFVPLAFIPVIGIEAIVLVTVPLAESVLGGYDWMYRPFTWYGATMLPFIFFGAVLGVQRIINWRVFSSLNYGDKNYALKFALASLIFSASFFTFYFYSPLPLARNSRLFSILPNAHSAIGHDLLKTIPTDAVLAVPDSIIPYVSQRKSVYIFPSYPDYRQLDYLFADTTQFWYKFHQSAWNQVLETGYFQVLSNQDGYLLAKRKPLEHALSIQFDNKLGIIGYTIPATTTIRGGQTLHPILGWRTASRLPTRYRTRIQLLDSQGHVWAEYDGEPQEGHLPTTLWEPGKTIGDQYALSLPSTMPPGNYQLVASIFEIENERQLGVTSVVAPVKIEKDKSNITATDLQKRFQLEQPLFVDMQEIRLIGFKPLPASVATNSNLTLGVYWRARSKPLGDYHVTIYLVDASGKIQLTQTQQPAAGAYPTTLWDEGEVLLDWHDLAIPAALTPGEYSVQVVLSDSATKNILGQTGLGKLTVTAK
jgi:uncharacterized membrane protein